MNDPKDSRIRELEAEVDFLKELHEVGELLDQLATRDRQLAAAREMLDKLHTARPLEEWHEDMGPVLWHHLPICEPPYCGTPMDSQFDEYPEGWLTHWTPLPNCNEIDERFAEPVGPRIRK